MRIEIVSPKHLSTPSGIKFDTYRFYLECICEHLTSKYTNLAGFVRQVHSTTSAVNRLPALDPNEVEQYLRIAWNTEYLLSIDHGDPEIIRINNQWAPIQAYYSVYSGLEALSYAINGDHAGSHQKALRKASDFLLNLGITPWNKAYEGSRGKSRSDHSPTNFPAGISIPHNLRRSGVKPIEMIAKCLKAEHSHRIDDKWKSKNESGCWKYAYDPNPTTLLHFLYRLRIKSNYQEIDTFVTDAPKENVLQFAQCLHSFASWTLALIEMILLRRFGESPIITQANAYFATNKDATDLAMRVSEYEAHSW